MKNSTILITFVLLILLTAVLVLFFMPQTLPKQAVLKPTPTQENGKDEQAGIFISQGNQPNYWPLRDFNVTDPNINAHSAVLFDTKSEKFLFQKDIHKALPIASLTKLMSSVIVVENFDLGSVITVPAEDLNVDGFGADFVKGEKIKASDLLKIMLVKSSNDAALVFQTEAEKNNIDFLTKMNDKAQEIGMTSTRFTNPAGLDDSAFSTAADLVKLVRYSRQYPLLWEILRTKMLDVSSIDGRTVHHLNNTDQLLGKLPDIIGGKTGFTDGAMGTMILVVNNDNGRSELVTVVLGSNDRFTEAQKLVEWGKRAFRWQ